jgi:hypothetical protein
MNSANNSTLSAPLKPLAKLVGIWELEVRTRHPDTIETTACLRDHRREYS